ncbi:MAG: acyl-CoA dehydrogenase [Geodermatophilaceae bacterium]|nr:acyl-CoA dehydrogenase [Geodermatophilaceae bacterium]
MSDISPAPRGAREELIGAPLGIKLDRSMPPVEVQAWLADALPGLAAGLAPHTSVRDPRRRWQLLSALGRTDLVVARLLEGHLDALAVLAEAERPAVPSALYGVWASASGGTGLSLRSPDRRDPGGFDQNRQESEPDATAGVLSGMMRFCSGAPLLDRALTTCRNEAGELLLLDILVRGPELRPVPGSWPALGMDASASVDVEVDELSVDETAVVGPPGFYLERAGLPLGGIGVAAVWLGGLQGLVDATLRVLGDRTPDDHGLAHLGAVTVAVESAAATLIDTAHRLRRGPVDPVTSMAALPPAELARIALICRSAVEAAVDVGTRRLPRVVGPVALGRDGDFAHRLADLEVFVRQHHAERDLARLGTAEFSEPWTVGPVVE